MSIEKARAHLEKCGFLDRLIEMDESTSTVELAAAALSVESGRIAKTLSLLTPTGPILILAEGSARIDNRKFKDTFHTKAKMIPPGEVEALVGHAPGGVCPFGIPEGIPVYLDQSLKKYDTVYPAAGNAHSAVRLSIQELEICAGSSSWVDVCRQAEL